MAEDVPSDLLAGQTVSHYRVMGRIGAGAMGVVYRARDESLDRQEVLVGGVSSARARAKDAREVLITRDSC